MSELITRDDLRTLLADWKGGRRTTQQLHDWAEQRYPGAEYEDEVVTEVVAFLDMLDMNLVIVDDIPLILRVLDLPSEQADQASALLRAVDSVEFERRRRALAGDPFYAIFCRS
jgi:hypothetical protein